MKDIIITGKRIKTEIIFIICSLAAAFVINIHAIVKFNSPWSELYSQLHVVLLIALIIYILILLIRLIIMLIFKMVKRY